MVNKYEISAPIYVGLYKEEQLKKIRVVASLINPFANDKLLNVGCGPFFSSSVFDCRLFGVDPSEKLLEMVGFRLCKLSIKPLQRKI